MRFINTVWNVNKLRRGFVFIVDILVKNNYDLGNIIN